MMSPSMWRTYIVPRHQRLNSAIRAADPNVKIMYHSCGAIFPMIGALIEELGIDVLNPLQPRAAGMDAARIKAAFGDRIAFHGGVDLQHTLPHGSPAEVEAEVRYLIETLGPGGGYVLSAAHYIQNDVPTENILALYQTDRSIPTAK
jgi:uroporphyrinogen decarboxylase